VQNCSLCNAQSPDTAKHCTNCKADLKEYSTTNVALKRIQENPRVESVILSVAADACPACQKYQGDYAKEQAPVLPIQGCSHPNGCRCFYQPVLSDIYP
jgi:hypothetical protein